MASKINTISFNIDIAPKAHDMGRNLLRGAGLTSLNSITEGGVTFYRINSFSDSLVKIVDGVDGNKGVWVKTNSGETNVYRGVFFIAAVNKGETYTLSAWVKGTAGTTLFLEVLNSIGTARKNSDGTDGTRYTGTGSFATISDDWRRVTFTFTVDDLNGGYVECNFFTNAVGEFTICEPKLERGDVATAFCLNEADLKGDKGDKGDDVYRIEVISSAGLVYHNGKLDTVLSAHVYGPNGEVTDRCNGTFTWHDLRVSNPIGTGKTYTAQATSAVDSYHYRCIYDGEVGKETYNVTYNSKQLQYNSKNIQF